MNMASFKNAFKSSKAIPLQIQLYCLSSDMFWVAALSYRVVATARFAQISLFFVAEAAFKSFFAPAFRVPEFFIHASHSGTFQTVKRETFLKRLVKYTVRQKTEFDS